MKIKKNHNEIMLFLHDQLKKLNLEKGAHGTLKIVSFVSNIPHCGDLDICIFFHRKLETSISQQCKVMENVEQCVVLYLPPTAACD